jgi:hypothetical protein
MVSRLKLLFVFLLGTFGLVWFAWVVPELAQSAYWSNLNPVQQYVYYNIGIFLVLTAGFGGFVSFILTQRLNIVQMLVNGLAGFLIFSFILDNFSPPFAVGHAGTLIIPTGDTLAPAAVDYMLGWVWIQAGAGGSLVYWGTYIITPAVAIIAAVLLFGLNRFVQLFAEAM